MFSFAHTNFSYLGLAVLSLKAAETASHSDVVTCFKPAEYGDLNLEGGKDHYIGWL